MIWRLLRRFGFAFWVGVKGTLSSASAILAFGLTAWVHNLLFERPLEAPLEIIFVAQLFGGLIITISVDIVLMPWTVLLSLASYGRCLKYWVSWLLMGIGSAPPILFMVYLSSFANTAGQETISRPISWVERVYILFIFASWLFFLTSSFAWALFSSHRKLMCPASH